MRCPPNLNRLEFTWKKCIKKYTEIKKFKHNILKVKQLTFQIDHYEQCLKVDSQRKDDIPVTVGQKDHCKVLTQEVNPTWFSQSLTYLVLRIKIEPVTVAADATVRVYVWLLLSENQVIFGTVWIRRAKTVLSGQCIYLLSISRHGESVTEYVSEPRRIRN